MWNFSELSGSMNGSEMEVEERECLQIYGMHFCGDCKNMMTPYKEAAEKLEFICRNCDKKEVDFSQFRDAECIIYNKELKPGTRKARVDNELVLDPTMPRIQRDCEDCGHNTMVYMVNADDSESSLLINLICENVANGRCDHSELLPIDLALLNGQSMPRE